jgi:hypothetical protein
MKRFFITIIAFVLVTTGIELFSQENAFAESNPVPISGASTLTSKQIGDYVLLHNDTPKLIGVNIYRLADLYLSLGRIEGIRGDIAFAQAVHETGYFTFGKDVLPEQNNYAGIGAVGGGFQGAYFTTPEEGVRAQIQHLKAYANMDPLLSEKVDPRFDYVKRGIAPYWTDLNGKWAVPGGFYGESILAIYNEMKAIQLTIPNVDNDVTHDLPIATLSLKYDRPLLSPDGQVSRILKRGYSYKIYGTLGNNYNLGGNYIVKADSSKMNVFIGRLYIPDNLGVLYKPDGTKHRNLTAGETIRVYSFDDNAYNVGGGYFIKKDPHLSLYKGVVTVTANSSLFNASGEVVKTLTKGQQFRVYNLKDKRMEVGGGLYILFDKNKNGYVNL